MAGGTLHDSLRLATTNISIDKETNECRKLEHVGSWVFGSISAAAP